MKEGVESCLNLMFAKNAAHWGAFTWLISKGIIAALHIP